MQEAGWGDTAEQMDQEPWKTKGDHPVGLSLRSVEAEVVSELGIGGGEPRLLFPGRDKGPHPKQ